ncbi:MAG: pilus assembly protein [Planctomycetales bacterium]|nr:pilus assembly protein [Planctomycetales bacterium]
MFRRRSKDRKGAAATEFAMIIPPILMLTFGTIEATSVIFLKEKITIAAHEGARVAIKKMSELDDVETTIEGYLSQRSVDISSLGSSAISVTPEPDRTEELQAITVTITAPVTGNTLLPNSFYTWFGGRNVSATCVMYKEFTHPDYEAELAAGG